MDLLVRTLGLPPGASMLDLGCGTGALTVPLAERFDRVIGADPSVAAGAGLVPFPAGVSAGAARGAVALDLWD